jgi:photosystem II stability/assembly factor-like uncharacterized protein
MKTKQIILILIGILCCALVGCKKAESTEAKGDTKATDPNTCVTEEPVAEADTAEAADTNSAEDTAAPASTTVSWEVIKEINPKDKKMTSRFVGFYNDSFGISTAQYGVLFYTADGGETWVAGKNQSDCIAGVEIIDENNAFIAANYSEVRVTKDGAKTWSTIPNFGNMSNEHCRYLSFIDANTGWIANKKEIGFTTDGGNSWTSLTVPENISIISAIWLNSVEEGYILNNKGKLFSTTDGGATWSEKDLGLEGMQVVVCPTAALHVTDQNNFQIIAFVSSATDNGCYYFSTSDGGTTWDKKEQIFNGKFGYVHLNREGNLLTYTDGTDKNITVYQLKQ